jgi:hypothetical protein
MSRECRARVLRLGDLVRLAARARILREPPRLEPARAAT